MGRYHGCCGQRLFDLKFKAGAVAEILRQTGHHADHLNIAALPGRWQLIRQTNLGTPAGKAEAKKQAAKQCQGFYATRRPTPGRQQ